MADIITFKRGPKAALPNSALAGEPLFCIDTQELYIGLGINTLEKASFLSKEKTEEIIQEMHKSILNDIEIKLSNDYGEY